MKAREWGTPVVGYQGSQEPEQWVGTRNQCVVQRGATGAPLGHHWPIYLVDIFSRAQRVTHGLTSAPQPGGGAPGAALSSALRQHRIESIRNVNIANGTIFLWLLKTEKLWVKKFIKETKSLSPVPCCKPFSLCTVCTPDARNLKFKLQCSTVATFSSREAGWWRGRPHQDAARSLQVQSSQWGHLVQLPAGPLCIEGVNKFSW